MTSTCLSRAVRGASCTPGGRLPAPFGGLKRRKSQAIIVASSAAAATTAAVPVPLSDLVGIVPIQVSMLAKVAAIYGVPTSPGDLGRLVGPIAIGNGMRAAGQLIFRSVLKLIPGANVAVGAVTQETRGASLSPSLSLDAHL